ncbi:mechanosensitive ion channel domain-containing protein [Reichenbachiella ulvae]|uniref:Mechanosensitive ion channel n=1 Tax=Reichenbachiella ulvae TaxID=2980104 RepID=A0ABT3CNL0_9BACT|nr:mechanosensitive ion channel domain-containing protein [Reichenbachiella ulvae]MCV9385059.1 mechanosensitive ion channel [Reichenbachiella ulvae]
MISNRFTLVFFLFLSSLSTIAQEEPKLKEQEELKPYSLSEIPVESEKMVSKINAEYLKVIAQPVAHQNAVKIDSLAKRKEQIKGFTAYATERNYGYSFIESYLIKWDEFIAKTQAPKQVLSTYTEALGKIRDDLSTEKKKWELTRVKLKEADEIPDNILDRTKIILDYLDANSKLVSDSLSRSLDLQNRIVDLTLSAETERDNLEQLLKLKFSNLVFQKEYSLFNLPNDSLKNGDRKEYRDYYLAYNLRESRLFLTEEWDFFTNLSIPFILILGVILWLRSNRAELETLHIKELELGQAIFDHPLLSSLFYTLLLTLGSLPSIPLPIKIVLSTVILLLFIVISSKIIAKPLQLAVYLISIHYISMRFTDLYILNDLMYRVFQLFVNLTLMAYLIYFIRNKARIVEQYNYQALWFKLMSFMAPVFLAALVVSAIANAVGYLYLAFLINATTVNSILIAILFGVIYSTTTSVFVLFVNTPIAQKSILITQYKDWTIKKFSQLAKIGYYFCWIYFTLAWFFLLDFVLEFVNSILELGVEVRHVNITILGVISFVVILVGSFGIAQLIRLLLKDEILSRFRLSKGVPMAISSMTYYVLISCGFFLALFSLGFNLENLGLLAGALGVGIGFGLQNIVSNFISGLILIFERPITIGDIVKLDDIEGVVASIGIRSSKIQQYDGAVLIVPNSDLISQKVVNHTLSDDQRRLIFEIRTKPEVELELVLYLLQRAAEEVDPVLEDPAPKAYFEGIDKQSAHFKLYYWVNRDILAAKSEVALRAHAILKESGIEILEQNIVKIDRGDLSEEKLK